MNKPKRVAITGAAGQIGYSILPRIAAGEIFGPETPVILQLLEVPPVMPSLEGVRMELEDCAFPLLHDITTSDQPSTAFRDADLVLLIGSKPRGKGMERKDLILENGPIFTGQGEAINEVAASGVRVIVVGNPCNTNCLITMHSAADVPNDRFTAMTRLDQNRAMAQLALKAGCGWDEIGQMIIWGNHSNTQYPDWTNAQIQGRSATEVIDDKDWFKDVFIETIQERGKAVIDARGKSSAMSAANAAIDHAHSLFHVSSDPISMCVISDGRYDIPEGIISSFPCTTDGKGNWKILAGMELDDYAKGMIAISTKELLSERETVQHLLSD